MVGEGAENDEGEEDPRSFKNKTVGQRMIIISAGVIMNVILGAICFITVYRFHGVPQMAAAVERIDPGSPAWEKGVHSNSRIIKMGDITNPSFNELKMLVALSSKESIPFTFVYLETARRSRKPSTFHRAAARTTRCRRLGLFRRRDSNW